MTFELLAERTLIDAESASTRHVLVRIQAPAADSDSERLPVNLAFVLDRSGSMQGEKIRLAREATLTAIRTLRERDRFSVVTYDDEVEVVVPATAATTEARHEAERRLRDVTARRMTDLCGGWLAGCEEVARGLDEGGVGRCLLLTDGLANVGVTDHNELVGHARELAARRVETTTFGVGRDFDERLLDDMADAGAGNFYFIEGAAQIPDFIASEVGEALEVVARDVQLVVAAPEGVRVSALNNLACTQEGTRAIVTIGTLISEQAFEVVLRLDFPGGALGGAELVSCSLTDRDEVLSAEAGALTFTYASAEESAAQVRERPVDRHVAAFSSAWARKRALELNDRGRYDEAQAELREMARQILEFAGDDRVLQAMVEELASIDPAYGRDMGLLLKKLHYARAHGALKRRDFGGRAMRSFERFDEE